MRVLLAAGLMLAALAVGAEEPAPGADRPGVDWPGFLGPTGDGKSPETGFFTAAGLRGARLLWHRRIGGGYSMPTISRGRLYQFSRVGDQARLECLRADTGAELWHFDYPSGYEDLYGYDNGPRSSPVVDGERVYILGVEGMLHCLSAGDGTLVWKLDTAARFGVVQNFFGVGCTPVVEGDLLIANIGGSPPENRDVPPGQVERARGNGTGIVAFDTASGAVRYAFSDELASYASPTLATIGGRRWGFMFARGGLVGFDPTTGRQDFHFPWRAKIRESVNASNPVVVGDEVLVSETYGPGSALLKVRPGGHEVVWQDDAARRHKSLQTHWNTPIHHAGHVYASSGRHPENAELRCVEWRTGTVKWSQPGLGRSSLLWVEDHFFCLTEWGELIVLRATPERYDEVCRIALEVETDAAGPRPRLLKHPAWAAPILAHGLLYVRGADRLVCVELTRGGTER